VNCVILQPSYIPWRGYFHQIYKADTFVFYDDVQYDRHGWRNRNRIKTPRGAQWLTIPLKSSGANWKEARICDMQIAWDKAWNEAHFQTIRHNYAKAPFYKRYESLLEKWYRSTPATLADFTIETTVEMARELGIRRTQFIRSSALTCTGTKTERLLSILRHVKATRYISGPSAKDYLETDKLHQEGIAVEWMEYKYPEYEQVHPPYDPQVSVLDLLFSVGDDAGALIWGGEQRSLSTAT
jgi:hypothetical protein